MTLSAGIENERTDWNARSSESRNFVFSPLSDLEGQRQAIEMTERGRKPMAAPRPKSSWSPVKIAGLVTLAILVTAAVILAATGATNMLTPSSSASDAAISSPPPASAPFSAVHSCLDNSGRPVDFWINLKSNRFSSSRNPMHRRGHAYGYFDSNSLVSTDPAPKFVLQSNGLFEETAAFMRTIRQIYPLNSTTPQNPDFGYFMYNDDIPGSTSSSSAWGHVKGVASFSTSGGFWIIHSHPNFPVHPNTSTPYNTTESDIYGQSSICLSLDRVQLNRVAQQLITLNPQAYAVSFAPNLTDPILDRPWATLLNQISDTSGNLSRVTPPVVYQRITLQTLRRVANTQRLSLRTRFQSYQFDSFAKNAAWASDLYGDFVAPSLGFPLFTSTWMRPFEPSLYVNTSKEVRNVKAINLTAAVNWGQSQDHSKWAISQSSEAPLACVGDLNKALSQSNRAGGTLCLTDSRLWSAFRSIMTPYTDAEEAIM